MRGLQKYSNSGLRQRSSSPKLQVLNTALMTAASGLTKDEARRDGEYRGRLVESAVGAHLANHVVARREDLSYWLDRNREVDFVLRAGTGLVALEVKSGRARRGRPGTDAFLRAHPKATPLLVGSGGLPVEDFLLAAPHLLRGASQPNPP